jgi:proton-translocating NADH-quinone oxidoreductase chain L
MLVVFPGLHAILLYIFGRYFSIHFMHHYSLVGFFIILIGAWANFFLNSLILNQTIYFDLFNWIKIASLDLQWTFVFDNLTNIMLLVVVSISFFVHVYSFEYMKGDPHFLRFIAHLSFFTFFMLILVTAGNFLQLFVGWEGVGFCSYLLINFWYTRLQANKAALKAVIINRVGDYGLLIGTCLLFSLTNTLDIFTNFAAIPVLINQNSFYESIQIICLLFFIGVVGKSAQIGLQTWLPDAMEGPTPVSALLHAATMVTAGIFLIIRCSPIFEYAPSILCLFIFFGTLTILLAGSISVVQDDIKKVIAYSTCGQLGYMLLICGLSQYQISLFHLFNHAFFKALLFLCAGAFIHASSDEQDVRQMGYLGRYVPLAYALFYIGNLALAGFIFLTGFYSKDILIEFPTMIVIIGNNFTFWISTLAAFFLTIQYSNTILDLSSYPQHRIAFTKMSDGTILLNCTLIILAICSIFIGYYFHELFIGFNVNFFDNCFFIKNSHFTIHNSEEFIPFWLKLVPVIFSLLFSFSFYAFANKYTYMNLFYISKWYFDKLNNFLAKKLLYEGYKTFYKIVDKGLIEQVGAKRLLNLSLRVSRNVSYNHTGLVFHYLSIIIFGLLFFFILANFLL